MPPRKRAAAKKTSTPSAPEPMDPGAREAAVATPSTNQPRDAYAVQMLIVEVLDLFPEVTYETSGHSAYNVATDVTFTDHETPELFPLLALVQSDERVRNVERDETESLVLVDFHPSLRTMDSRAPFGLAEAHAILTENAEAITLDDEGNFALGTSEDTA